MEQYSLFKISGESFTIKYMVNITDKLKKNIDKVIYKTIQEFSVINYDRTITMEPKEIRDFVIKSLNSHLSMIALDGRENTLDTKRVVLDCVKKGDNIIFPKSFYYKSPGLRERHLQKDYENMVLEHTKAATQIIMTGIV